MHDVERHLAIINAWNVHAHHDAGIATDSRYLGRQLGGFAHDDTNVMLLVSHPSLKARTVTSFVETAQVAPTILQLLGLDPDALDAVRIEGTPVLPGIRFQQ